MEEKKKQPPPSSNNHPSSRPAAPYFEGHGFDSSKPAQSSTPSNSNETRDYRPGYVKERYCLLLFKACHSKCVVQSLIATLPVKIDTTITGSIDNFRVSRNTNGLTTVVVKAQSTKTMNLVRRQRATNINHMTVDILNRTNMEVRTSTISIKIVIEILLETIVVEGLP